MTLLDALQVVTLVLVNLGGGGAIVLGLSKFLGDRWLQAWQGQIDAKLQRLDAALIHKTYLLQRITEFELEALTDCWRAARACLPLINGTRPHDCGLDPERLKTATAQLSAAHNSLIETLGKHEVHLPKAVVDTLEAIGRTVRLEILQLQTRTPFEDVWWEQGEKNRDDFKGQCDTLLHQVRTRVAEIRAEAAKEADKQ